MLAPKCSPMNAFAFLAALPLLAAAATYTSVSVDGRAQLHIFTSTGGEMQPKKSPDQTGFDSPLISPDRHTVGWLVLYDSIAGKLVLYRDGRVLHTFDTDQVFWDWQFQENGTRVAYSTGPTHGGAAECVLRDVDSGRIVARWTVGTGTPPGWARDLRQ